QTKYKDKKRQCKECQQSFRFQYVSQTFCSQSCSATATNRHRKTIKYCKRCRNIPVSRLGGICQNCKLRGGIQSIDYAAVTIKELRKQYGTYQSHAKIRGHARSCYISSKRPFSCARCGYK